jgi:UDP-glucose 4-epimerase
MSQSVPSNNSENTLVIGGAGFIGSYLVPMLIESGRRVTVIGRKVKPLYALPEGVTYFGGDFGRSDLLGDLLNQNREIIHLAYSTVPNTSYDNPLADLLQNLPPVVKLFSEVAARGGKLVLVSSGGTVYGDAIQLPIGETHITKPISPYGVTKLTVENYAHLYSQTHGLRYVCVRPSNAYGAGQRPFAGQGFIATAIASVMRNEPIRIFGHDGTVRDYLYVSDLARGIVNALFYGKQAETYNIGSGLGLSNRDVINAITPLLTEIGYTVHVEFLPERAFDVKTNILDSKKLQLHTGWKPMVSFDVGLRLTCEWLRANYG